MGELVVSTPVGELFLLASARGLCGLYMDKKEVPSLEASQEDSESSAVLNECANQLRAYFARKLQKFDVPLDLKGTEFQRKVWAELMRIPFGQTASYKQIAERIGQPAATRAVGAANGRNPVCIIVPCHRVITADGRIGGYSGGLAFKRALLDLEGADYQ